MLRKSKQYPAFHWPKELVDQIKGMRNRVTAHVNQVTNYIRIRPEERDRSWKIRADVKPKSGTGKFTPFARWNIPPLDPTLRGNIDWFKPCWTASRPSRTDTAGEQGQATGPRNFTEDEAFNVMSFETA